MINHYVLKIDGYHEVTTNLPGKFQHGRDEIITPKAVEKSAAYNLARKLNNVNQGIRRI